MGIVLTTKQDAQPPQIAGTLKSCAGLFLFPWVEVPQFVPLTFISIHNSVKILFRKR